MSKAGDQDSLRPKGGVPARFIAVSPRQPLIKDHSHLHSLPHNPAQCNSTWKSGKVGGSMDAQSSMSAAENTVFYSVLISVPPQMDWWAKIAVINVQIHFPQRNSRKFLWGKLEPLVSNVPFSASIYLCAPRHGRAPSSIKPVDPRLT